MVPRGEIVQGTAVLGGSARSMRGENYIDGLTPGHRCSFPCSFYKCGTVVFIDVQVFRGAIQPRQDQFLRRKTAFLTTGFALKDSFHGGLSRRYAIRTSVLTPILSAATSWVKG
jgi:hypothetical protein